MIIISSSSDDNVGGSVVGKVKKGVVGLRNVPRVGSSRVSALNKQRVKSLCSSSFRKSHLEKYPTSIDIHGDDNNECSMSTIMKNGIVVRSSNGWLEIEKAYQLADGDV
ncbi:hypothetical protein ACH5RR_040254 [Cinchona calisaya]|uniref:Uncharacterized protein n=1 Tax=Cinchona calisaya TaxID=153742 RepID=A0ABD2XVG3_9GENT